MAPRLRSAASSKADERLGLELEHVVYVRAQPTGLVADEVADLGALAAALDAHPDIAGIMLPEARNKSHLIFGLAHEI